MIDKIYNKESPRLSELFIYKIYYFKFKFPKVSFELLRFFLKLSNRKVVF